MKRKMASYDDEDTQMVEAEIEENPEEEDVEEEDVEEESDDEDGPSIDLLWKGIVKPDEPCVASSIENYFLRITNACLGPDAKDNTRTCLTVMQATDEDSEPQGVVCTLKNNYENHRLDMLVTDDVQISVSGDNPSPIYLVGYLVPAEQYVGDRFDFGEDLEDMGEIEDEEMVEKELSKLGGKKQLMGQKRKLAELKIGDEDEDADATSLASSQKKKKTADGKAKPTQQQQQQTKGKEENKNNKNQNPNQKNQNQNPNQKNQPNPNQKNQNPNQKNQNQKNQPNPNQKNQNPNQTSTQTSNPTPTPTPNPNPTATPNPTPNPNPNPNQNPNPNPEHLTKSQKKKNKKKKQAEAAAAAAAAAAGATTEGSTKPTEEPAKTTKEEEPAKTTAEAEKTTENTNAKEAAQETTESTENNNETTKEAGWKKNQGISYKDIRVGEGKGIKKGSKVSIYFVGQLSDKSVFERELGGDGKEIVVGDKDLVEGLHRGLIGMKAGGKRKIQVPANLGYGETGTSKEKEVPPNSELTYTVEVKTVS